MSRKRAQDWYDGLLEHERARVDRWLSENPPPEGWREGRIEWAYLEMPLWSSFLGGLHP